MIIRYVQDKNHPRIFISRKYKIQTDCTLEEFFSTPFLFTVATRVFMKLAVVLFSISFSHEPNSSYVEKYFSSVVTGISRILIGTG